MTYFATVDELAEKISRSLRFFAKRANERESSRLLRTTNWECEHLIGNNAKRPDAKIKALQWLLWNISQLRPNLLAERERVVLFGCSGDTAKLSDLACPQEGADTNPCQWVHYHFNEDAQCRSDRLRKSVGLSDHCLPCAES